MYASTASWSVPRLCVRRHAPRELVAVYTTRRSMRRANATVRDAAGTCDTRTPHHTENAVGQCPLRPLAEEAARSYGEGLPPVGTFQPFEEARKVGLEGTEEWEAWCGDGHRPYDILSRRHEQGRGVGCRGRSGWARAKRCEADAFFSGSSEGSHTHTRTHTHALSHNQDAPGTPSPP